MDKFEQTDLIVIRSVGYQEYFTTMANLASMGYKVGLSQQYQVLNEVMIVERSGITAPTVKTQTKTSISAEERTAYAPANTADLVESAPGVYMQKSQAGGGSPNIRGFEANRILLMIDGVRLNNAIFRSGHLQNILTVDDHFIHKVDVLLGPASLHYGSDALGGVIQMSTKEFLPGLNKTTHLVNLNADHARSGFNSSYGIAVQRKNWSSFTGLSFKSSGDLRMGRNRFHGYEDWGKVHVYQDPDAPADTTAIFNENPNIQPGVGFQQFSFIEKIQYRRKKSLYTLNIQHSQTGQVDRFDRLNDVTDGSPKFAEWYYGPEIRTLVSFGQYTKRPGSLADLVRQNISYQNQQESRHTRKYQSLDRENREESVHALEHSLFLSKEVDGDRKLTYGTNVWYNYVSSEARLQHLDANLNELTSETTSTRYPDGGSDYLSAAVFVSLEKEFENGNVAQAGARYTYQYIRSVYDENFFNLPYNSITTKFDAVTASMGLFIPQEHIDHNVSVSSGFHAPNIDDLSKVFEKNGEVTVPNVNLRPEYTISSEYHGTINSLYDWLDADFAIFHSLILSKIEAAAFQINGSDSILYDGEVLPVRANTNQGMAQIYGAQMWVKARFLKRAFAEGSITKTYGNLLDDAQTPLSHIPPLFGRVAIGYKQRYWEPEISFIFNGSKELDEYGDAGTDNLVEATEDGTPAWHVLNLSLRYKRNMYQVQVGLNNLFDTHYKTFASGISQPGRSVSISFTAKL